MDKQLTKAQLTSHYKQIKDIIIVSAKLGVTELKFGDLHVRFGPESQTLSFGLTENERRQNPVVNTPSPVSGEKPHISAADQELIDDMNRSQLMIEDPLSYENELIARALEGAGSVERRVGPN